MYNARKEEEMEVNKIDYNGNSLIDLTGDTATPQDVISGDTFHDATGKQLTGTMAVAPTFPNENEAAQAHYYGTNFQGKDGKHNVFVQIPENSFYPKDSWIGYAEPNLIPENVKAGVTLSGKTGLSPLVGSFTSDATALASHIYSGKTAYVNGNKITGTITDRGNVSVTLNAGSSYTIPYGLHHGEGTVTAKSLADQTSADAVASDISSGKTAWVNGSKITGTLETDIISQVKKTYTVDDNNPIVTQLLGDMFPNLKLDYIGTNYPGRYHIISCFTYVTNSTGSRSGIDIWALIRLSGADFLMTTRTIKNVGTSYPWNELDNLDAAWIRSSSSLRLSSTNASTYRSSPQSLYQKAYQVANLTATGITGSYIAHSTFTIRKNY